jgi:endoglucanase
MGPRGIQNQSARDIKMRPKALILALILPLPAMADPTFTMQRGLNVDFWMDWGADVEHPTVPDWSGRIPKDVLKTLHDNGFDTLRIPLNPAPLLAMGKGDMQGQALDQIGTAVTILQDAGFKVIVDLHAFPRAAQPLGIDAIVQDPAVMAKHLALTTALATRLRDFDPARTAIEVLNEPTSRCDGVVDATYPAWQDQVLALHHAARNAAPALPIVLSGACWGGIEGLEAINPSLIADDNVIWSFHSYDPFIFTHQTANWTDGTARYFADIPYPPTLIDDLHATELVAQAAIRAHDDPAGPGPDPYNFAWDMVAYRDDIMPADDAPRRAAAWADAHGIARSRIIMGEFGAKTTDNDGKPFDRDSHTRFLTDKRLAAEAQGFGWAIWPFAGMQPFMNMDSTHQIDPWVCDGLGLPGC